MTREEPTLAKGFHSPVIDAQSVFRATLAAMSRPGSVNPCLSLADVPLPPVMASIALTLLDFETPYALAGMVEDAATEAYLSFHTGAPRVNAPNAVFALTNPSHLDAQAVEALCIGSPDYPDRSATVILDVGRFDSGYAVELSGPGVKTTTRFSAELLNPRFWGLARENAALYPLGVDFIFCGQSAVAALPRSTRIKLIGS